MNAAKPIPKATTDDKSPKLVVRRGSLADALREVIRKNMSPPAAEIGRIPSEKYPGLGLKPKHKAYVHVLRSQMRRKSLRQKYRKGDKYTVDQIISIATTTKLEGGPVKFRNLLNRIKKLVDEVGSFERIDKIVEVLGRW